MSEMVAGREPLDDELRSQTVDMTITLRDLTLPQAAAMRAMFETMRQLGGLGGSRWVSFYSDGDGNFRPRPTYRFSAHKRAIEEWSKGEWWSDEDDAYRIDFDAIAWRMFPHDGAPRMYPKHFRRIRFWLAWLFGGDYYHPKRGSGWQPSLWRRTRKWRAEGWYEHRTWWRFCRPSRKRLTTAQMKAHVTEGAVAEVLPPDSDLPVKVAGRQKLTCSEGHVWNAYLGSDCSECSAAVGALPPAQKEEA